MREYEVIEKRCRILECLANLPRKIVALCNAGNVTEFVLHDLCHEHCFNLSKAAYFVDNPDFDCIKGITGFSRQQTYGDCQDIWKQPDSFSNYMNGCKFNKKVKNMHWCSLKRKNDSHEKLAKAIVQDLEFRNYALYSWPMKHHNHGVIIYEKADEKETFADEYIPNGLNFLSFCPIV